MDLKNGTITLRELMADPRSAAVFQRRFGRLLRHPMAAMAMPLTLNQLAEMAAVKLPRKAIEEALEELRGL